MMRPASFLLATSALILVVAGTVSCGGPNGVGCDFREGSLNGPEDRCQERRGLQSTAFGPACEASGGVVIEDGCPREGIIGGCDLGQDVFDWYYAPTTVEDINCDTEVLDPPDQ
jgi:hypothetical protein